MLPRSLPVLTLALLLLSHRFALAQDLRYLDSDSADRVSLALDVNAPIPFLPPPDDSSPNSTRGAGSRDGGQCSANTDRDSVEVATVAPTLMALVPLRNYGLTQSDRPTLWVYLPQTSAHQLILSLKDEESQQLFNVTLPITGEPGVVGLHLPEDMPPLAVGKTYEWAVILTCGERPNPNDPRVTAYIRRVAPSQSMEGLDQQSPLAQARWYAQQGIWYDALTSLVESRHLQPNDASLVTLWTNFLTQPLVDLTAIADQPLRFSQP